MQPNQDDSAVPTRQSAQGRRVPRVAGRWYYLVLVGTMGLFAWVPFLHAATRVRAARARWLAALFGTLDIVMYVLMALTPHRTGRARPPGGLPQARRGRSPARPRTAHRAAGSAQVLRRRGTGGSQQRAGRGDRRGVRYSTRSGGRHRRRARPSWRTVFHRGRVAGAGRSAGEHLGSHPRPGGDAPVGHAGRATRLSVTVSKRESR